MASIRKSGSPSDFLRVGSAVKACIRKVYQAEQDQLMTFMENSHHDPPRDLMLCSFWFLRYLKAVMNIHFFGFGQYVWATSALPRW